MKAPDAFRTISEVASDLDLPQHVLRFWETRFSQIKPMKRGGGRRYYRPEDIDLLRGIRLLLYGEGFTIRGVQRLLKDKGVGFVVSVGQSGSVQTVTASDEEETRTTHRPSRRAAAPPEPVFEADDAANEDDAAEGPVRTDPVFTPAPVPVPRQVNASAQTAFALAPEKRRRVEAALGELLEAKRILDELR
jgi:DNA-binding transcriptional MerR regulator